MKSALFLLLILSPAWLIAQDASSVPATSAQAESNFKIEELNKTPVEAKFASGGTIHMSLCSSGIELIGRDEQRVRVSYPLKSDENVKVRINVLGDHADLRVSGCTNHNFQMTIEVPKASNLDVRMFAGELDMWGITGDKDVELHAGQLTMEIGNPDDYGHVRASVSTGDLEAAAFSVSKGGLFRSFEHTGPGKYRIQAHVGAGELDLR
jgi:hypothetical protein